MLNFYKFLWTPRRLFEAPVSDDTRKLVCIITCILITSIVHATPQNALGHFKTEHGTLRGPITAVYDTNTSTFYGLVLAKPGGHSYVFARNPLGFFGITLLTAPDFAAFMATHPSLLLCPIPPYRKAMQKKMLGLAALAFAGLCIGGYGAYQLSTAPRQEAQFHWRDLAHSLGLLFMYLGTTALTGGVGIALFLCALTATYTYSYGTMPLLPLIVGIFLTPSSLAILLKRWLRNAYPTPSTALKYAQRALQKRMGN